MSKRKHSEVEVNGGGAAADGEHQGAGASAGAAVESAKAGGGGDSSGGAEKMARTRKQDGTSPGNKGVRFAMPPPVAVSLPPLARSRSGVSDDQQNGPARSGGDGGAAGEDEESHKCYGVGNMALFGGVVDEEEEANLHVPKHMRNDKYHVEKYGMRSSPAGMDWIGYNAGGQNQNHSGGSSSTSSRMGGASSGPSVGRSHPHSGSSPRPPPNWEGSLRPRMHPSFGRMVAEASTPSPRGIGAPGSGSGGGFDHEVMAAVARSGPNSGEFGIGRASGGRVSGERVSEEFPRAPLQFEIDYGAIKFGEPRVRVGIGGYGMVYRAQWRGTLVAVKELLDKDPSDAQVDEFRREVLILSQMRHPNIVLWMGACTTPPNLAIVMEFMQGGSMYKLLHTKGMKLDGPRRLMWATHICKGMTYLHEGSPPIIHRDLNTNNLLVDQRGNVKISDFGLSRVKTMTQMHTSHGRGTCAYSSPEVIRCEKNDEKGDVFSFAVVLWEMCTGLVPWEGVRDYQVMYLVSEANERLPLPDTIPADVRDLITRCWAESPAERPSFAEVMAQLRTMTAPGWEMPPMVHEEAKASLSLPRTRSGRVSGSDTDLVARTSEGKGTSGDEAKGAGPAKEGTALAEAPAAAAAVGAAKEAGGAADEAGGGASMEARGGASKEARADIPEIPLSGL